MKEEAVTDIDTKFVSFFQPTKREKSLSFLLVEVVVTSKILKERMMVLVIYFYGSNVVMRCQGDVLLVGLNIGRVYVMMEHAMMRAMIC